MRRYLSTLLVPVSLLALTACGAQTSADKTEPVVVQPTPEPTKRGIYAGCIGYFASNGSMDTCIALRTGLVKDGVLYVQAGVGVVADSDPAAEYQESMDKARALIRAAETARAL